MRIENVNDVRNEGGIGNLNLNKLKENTEYELLAYLLNYKTGLTVYEKGYYTFYVKDENGNIASARLFGVDKFLEDGFKAMLMKDKPVKLFFTAQIYNGFWSLIVKDIELWNGPFDYARFIGQAEYRTDSIIQDAYMQYMGSEIPNEYYREYFPDVCEGRIGGFLALLEKAFFRLYAYQFSFMDEDMLHKCFFLSMQAYFQYLELKKQYSIIPVQDMLQVVNSLNLAHKDTDYGNALLETTLSLFGLSKPKHLYAHLIYDTVKQTEDHLKIIYRNQGVPFGSAVKIDGRDLLRY